MDLLSAIVGGIPGGVAPYIPFYQPDYGTYYATRAITQHPGTFPNGDPITPLPAISHTPPTNASTLPPLTGGVNSGAGGPNPTGSTNPIQAAGDAIQNALGIPSPKDYISGITDQITHYGTFLLFGTLLIVGVAAVAWPHAEPYVKDAAKVAEVAA